MEYLQAMKLTSLALVALWVVAVSCNLPNSQRVKADREAAKERRRLREEAEELAAEAAEGAGEIGRAHV